VIETTDEVTLGRHRIFTISVGTGHPLLLIMGLGGNCEMWRPLLPYFRHRHVIAFDAPGTGRSSTPAWGVPVPELARLAVEVLRHYGVARADLLGYSYGGAVAQQLAFQHPVAVRRLVLAATTMGAGSPLGDPRAAQELATPARYYDPDLFERSAAEIYGGRVGRDAEIRSRMAAGRSTHPPSPYGYNLQLLAGMGWTSQPFARFISQPTLIISGDDDPLVPIQNAHSLANEIPHATLEVVKGAGHLLLLDEAERVARIINAFYDRPMATPSA